MSATGWEAPRASRRTLEAAAPREPDLDAIELALAEEAADERDERERASGRGSVLALLLVSLFLIGSWALVVVLVWWLAG